MAFKETKNYIQRIKGYMNTDLTTGKTIEGERVSADTGITAKVVADTSNSSTYTLSQENAQYLVDMMRLRMMSRMNELTSSLSNISGQGTFL